MKFILGKKLEMTQTWTEKGRVVPVTILEAGPCYVSQLKSMEKDGYVAVQLGFGSKKKATKSMKGHVKELPMMRFFKEYRIEEGKTPMVNDKALKRGDVIDVSIFSLGDTVKIIGTSKGKGFQGVVKRHGFHGHPPTHGHKDQERMPGAIGAGGVQHVFKGTRMAGRMGGERVTVQNLKVVGVDKEHNRLTVKGAVPGARNTFVVIVGS